MFDSELLINRTTKAHKTYSFADDANPRTLSEYWFQNSEVGKTLFLVFYTQACRYSKCLGCNLPSKMSTHHIDFSHIMRQVDAVFHNILNEHEKKELKKIIISNNGSVLDEDTFSTSALIYLLAKINLECPNIEVVSMETRIEYIDIEEVEVLARAMLEGITPTALELAIGVEAFDDQIRNEHFTKGLNIDDVTELVKVLNRVNTSFQKKDPEKYRKIKLKTYFMQKPVSGISEEEAVEDIKQGIDFLHALSKQYDVEINMHLNPTYVAKGTILEEEFKAGNFAPPSLESVREAVMHAQDKSISIFVGLYDEGLAVEGGSFIRDDREDDKILVKKLEAFNSSQDFSLIKK